MSAPPGYANKTGRGRSTGRARRVVEVESLPCSATLDAEAHVLRNTPAGVTRCLWCRETWAALDDAARGAA